MQYKSSDSVAEGLAVVVLPQSEWDAVKNSLNKLEDFFLERKKEELNSEWLVSSEARKLLGVSQKTWQTYRDERRIPFSQFGRKIFVRRGDIEAFLEAHCIHSKR